MKKIIAMLAMCASLAILAVSAAAQTTTPAKPAAPAQGPCSAENKQAWYNEFRETFKTNQTKAYDLAQKYLACPAEAGEEQIRKYLKEQFVDVIDKAARAPQVGALVYDKKDYNKAFELGRQVLAEEPNNLKVLTDLSWAGYALATAKNESHNADTLAYSKKAIELIQSGTTPASWLPYVSKDEALAYLNNTIGVLTLSKNPAEALPYLLKAAQLEGKLKKQAITYGYIGDAYQAGPYERLAAAYKEFEGKDETPASKLALENVNQVVDRIIDAFARAVALAGNDASLAASKKAWLDTLTSWYKYRHNQSDAGLNDLIAGVLAKPLPPQPTPLTVLPASSTSTPTSGTGTGTSPVGTATSAAATSAPKTNTTTGTTPAKPKPRNNHRRAN